ncbi:MAG: small subunit ribosomal protein S16 [Alphaproteobacteria bacterium]|jgi:small subunit ribosomal protein S16
MSVVKLRLARGGAKKRPYYYIVAASNTAPRDGRYIERIGSYNPMLKKDDPDRVKLLEDRVKHWLSVGGQPTDRVARFFDKAGLLKREARNNPSKGLPGKKRLERETAEAEAKAAAAEAAVEEVVTAPAETPAE